jgi:hypothetical protein
MTPKKLIIEIARPPFTDEPDIYVHRPRNFTKDQLSADMVCVFEVEARNKKEALALITEKLANVERHKVKRLF